MKKAKSILRFKISNLDITCSSYCIHISNSYKVRKRKEMKEILNELEESLYKHPNIDTPFNYRTKRGMIREWIAHNNAYKLKYKQDRTGSVDLEYPQKWQMKVLYFFIGMIRL